MSWIFSTFINQDTKGLIVIVFNSFKKKKKKEREKKMDYCEAPRINYFDWMQVMKAYQSSHWVPGLIH